MRRDAKTFSDKLASSLVRLTRYVFKLNYVLVTDMLAYCYRWGFDFVSGYRHKPIPPGSNMTASGICVQHFLLKQETTARRVEERGVCLG